MVNSKDLVAVSSRSFSKDPVLRQYIKNHFRHVKFNDKGVKLVDEELVDFLCGANRAIIGLEKIDKLLISKLPELKAICKMGTGIDKVDCDELNRRKIFFSATPGLNKRSVSELVLGLILTLLRQLKKVNTLVCQGIWSQPMGRLLSNKTVGIIGYGDIGQDLSKLLSVFDCKCLVYDVRVIKPLVASVKQVNLDILLSYSDIVTLHIPLLPENFHFIGHDEFLKMKKGSVLINTARGGLVDEHELYLALKNGLLASAAVDVAENEPFVSEKLLMLDNVFVTSHIGGSTREVIQSMGKKAVDVLIGIDI